MDRDCPRCGRSSGKDPGAAASGFCGRCDAYTGLCGTGRDLLWVPPSRDQVGPGDWDTSCPAFGAELWLWTWQGRPPVPVLLCAGHGAKVRAGMVPAVLQRRLSQAHAPLRGG